MRLAPHSRRIPRPGCPRHDGFRRARTIRVPTGAFASVVMLTGEVVPRPCWSAFVTPGDHGSATGRFWLARRPGVTCFGLTGLAPASRGLIAARHGFAWVVSSPVASPQRFASSAGHLGQSSSTGSRRGGDNCTAAASEVVLVLAGGGLLAGHARLLRHRETGMPRAVPGQGPSCFRAPPLWSCCLERCRET